MSHSARRRRSTALAGLLALLSLLATGPLHAQQAQPREVRRVELFPAATAAAAPNLWQDTAEDRTGQMIAAGALAGAVGMVVAGVALSTVERRHSSSCHDWCGLAGLAVGGVAGEAVGMALGIHAGNRKQGSFGRTLAATVTVGTLGFIIAPLALSTADVPVPPAVILVGTPVLQLILGIQQQKNSAAERARTPDDQPM